MLYTILPNLKYIWILGITSVWTKIKSELAIPNTFKTMMYRNDIWRTVKNKKNIDESSIPWPNSANYVI